MTLQELIGARLQRVCFDKTVAHGAFTLETANHQRIVIEWRDDRIVLATLSVIPERPEPTGVPGV